MDDLKSILERVRARVGAKPEDCSVCHDTGLVHTRTSKGIAKTYACSCPKGAPNREPLFFPSDKNRERPFFLPVYGEPRRGSVQPAKGPEGETKAPRDRTPYKDD